MCGIAGSYREDISIDLMLDRIAHRGPDGRGVCEHGEATHGHVRLALVDLSEASAQPFIYRESTLSFVGEIWNWRDLREELSGLGHDFQTEGDTEVLAAALDEWGEEALPRLEGMFGFAWSSRDGRNLLARDRFGKIPLYARRTAAGFSWCSERKGFEGQTCEPVRPGTVVDLAAGKVLTYYDLSQRRTLTAIAPGEVLELLRRGVRRRLWADAPVSCLISGGLDSSLIIALAREEGPATAYHAYCDEESLDLAAARRLCSEIDVELREVRVKPPSFAEAQEAVRVIESPLKAQVEIAALCIPLAERIAADGFKACLSGEAADEMFGGYGNQILAAHGKGDRVWSDVRLKSVRKMSEGNHARCNKAFMAHGVECRLPFMERELVERVVGLGREACPPNKVLLKKAAEEILPAWVIKRKKEVFQGTSGSAASLARSISNPKKTYGAEYRRLYGKWKAAA